MKNDLRALALYKAMKARQKIGEINFIARFVMNYYPKTQYAID